MEMETDRISNLPSECLEQILTHMPLKEAMGTSVLSSQWRHRASRLPHLVFDGKCHSSDIDHLLLVHNGPVHKFQLSGCKVVGTDKDLDRWILYLSQKSIKEFILLQYRPGRPYKLPSSLFSCQGLTSLELCTCVLKPPSSFKGFKSLKSIDFEEVTMDQDVFEDFIIGCRFLERLRLVHCQGLIHLNIDAPNLQYLYFRGGFKDINLVNATNLVDVSVVVDDDKYLNYHRQVSGPSSNLVKFLSYLPNHVKNLEFHGLSLMYLAIGALPGKLCKSYSHLTCLHLSISLTDPEQCLTALCLLRSCPALQELRIQVNPWDGKAVGKGNFWLDNDRKCLFRQLRRVDINDIRDVKGEIEFVGYLLMNSPVLERLSLHPYGVDKSKLEKKLLRYKRSSVNSKIIFPGPSGYF